jgi:hypothetical protein
MPAIRLAGLSLIAVTGVAGLIGDSWPSSVPWAFPYMHAGFGALLLSMVFVGFRQQTAGRSLMHAAARALCRRLSRDVYLLMYLVFGADLFIRAAAGAGVSTPPENLRDYFSYGLAALLTIRVLTVFSVRQPPALRMSPQLARAEDAAAPQ